MGEDKTVSTMPQRKYVRQIAKDLGIKLEKKLMKRDYCYSFIKKYKFEHLKYMKENNIPFPPSQKQLRYIKNIQKVMQHEYDDEELYQKTFKTLDEANAFIAKWKNEYHKIIKEYYDNNKQDEENEWTTRPAIRTDGWGNPLPYDKDQYKWHDRTVFSIFGIPTKK